MVFLTGYVQNNENWLYGGGGGGVSPKSYQLKGSETVKSKNLSPMIAPLARLSGRAAW